MCVQLGDVVPFRLHWPRGVDLRANNMQYRPYGRNPSHKLGNNARDDAANIGAASEQGCVTSDKQAGAPADRSFSCPTCTLCNLAHSLLCCAGPMCFTGKNRVTLTAFDQRRYAFGVQLARKRSQIEVRSHAARCAADPGECSPGSGASVSFSRRTIVL